MTTKFCQLLLACSLLINTVWAQFIPSSIPDNIYPAAGSPIFSNTTHLSSYDYPINTLGMTGNFNAYSWCNDDASLTNNAGIAFTYMDPSNTTINDQGHIYLTGKELEIALIENAMMMQVLAVYESFLGGVYADLYEYNSFGTLTPIFTNVLLDPFGRKPRVSQIKSENIAITYETLNGIAVQTYSSFTGFTPPCEIAGSFGGSIPDVSLNAANNLNIYVAYYQSISSEIIVCNYDYLNISFGGVLTFNIDDQMMVATDPTYIDLDSWYLPSLAGLPQWAYVYDQQNELLAHIYNPSATPIFMDMQLTSPILSSDFIPKKPSITYDAYGTLMEIAWSNEMLTGVTNRTVGVQIDNFGNFLLGPGIYFQVQQTATPMPHMHPRVVLSKNKVSDNTAFCVFSLDYMNNISEMNYKFKDMSAGSTYKTPNNTMNLAMMYPNPFTTAAVLSLENVSIDDTINIQVFDLLGRLILQQNDNIDAINFRLSEMMPTWQNGVYLINVQHKDKSTYLKIIKE